MNRIARLFENKKKDILNIYFTAGYPKLESTSEILLLLDKAGVDLIEIGMPYSDPMADGPTIQESGQVALKNGMKVELLFEQIAKVRELIDTPLILMGYFNQVMRYGEETFFRKAKAVGVDGFILPDMPLHIYENQFKSLLEELDLGISFLISPQTDDDRIRKIDQLSRGFVYMVSSASITGSKAGISSEQLKYFNRINKLELKTPRLIGFGISDADTFATACKYANGAIIGSAFIKSLGDGLNIKSSVENFITGLLPKIISEA